MVISPSGLANHVKTLWDYIQTQAKESILDAENKFSIKEKELLEKLAESVDEIKILEKTVNNLHEENNYLNKELLSIQNRTEKKSHEAIKLTEQLKAFYEKLANSSKENFNLNALLLKSQDSLDSLRLEKNRLAESFDNKID